MNKRLSAIFCAASIASLCFCIDFGGVLQTTTGLTAEYKEPALDQVDVLAMWVRIPFTQSMIFSAEGNFKADIGSTIEEKDFTIDLPLLKLTTPFGSTAKLEAGRFTLSDISSCIFFQPADGVRYSFSGETANWALYGGYTGLTNGLAVTMNTQEELENTAWYACAQAYTVGAVSVTFPALFTEQSLCVDVWGFFDTPDLDNSPVYATFGLYGPLSTGLYYTVTSTSELILQKNKTSIANLSKVEVSWYPVQKVSMTAGILYASGDNGILSPFEPVTLVSAATSAEDTIKYSDMLKVGFTATFKPSQDLFFSAGSHLFLDSHGTYEAIDWSAGGVYTMFSDLRFSVSLGQRIPKDFVYDFFADLGITIIF